MSHVCAHMGISSVVFCLCMQQGQVSIHVCIHVVMHVFMCAYRLNQAFPAVDVRGTRFLITCCTYTFMHVCMHACIHVCIQIESGVSRSWCSWDSISYYMLHIHIIIIHIWEYAICLIFVIWPSFLAACKAIDRSFIIWMISFRWLSPALVAACKAMSVHSSTERFRVFDSALLSACKAMHVY